MTLADLEIDGLKKWTIATLDETSNLLQRTCEYWGKDKFPNIIKNYNFTTIRVRGENCAIWLDRDFPKKSDGTENIPFMICNKQYASFKFFIENINSKNLYDLIKIDSIKNKIDSVIDFFISNELIPLFNNDEINDVFEKICYKEKLINRLNDINEKIKKNVTPEPGIYGLLDYEKRLYGLDICQINSSLMKYCNKSKEFLNSLFQGLDDYSKQKQELIREASQVSNLLKKPLNISNEFIKKERDVFILRHKYIQQKLDFTFDTIYRILLSFRDEITSIEAEISNIALENGKLSALHALENKQRPSFFTLVEYTSQIISKHLNRFEWYEKNSSLINEIIKIYFDSFKHFDIFITKKKQDFITKCLNESIEESICNEWFEEWRTEKIIFEEKLTSIIEAAIDRKVEPSCALKIASELKTYSLIIDEFYENERIGIHQKYAFQHCGDLHEKFEKESELSKRYDKFHLSLEENIFNLPEAEQRMLVTKWAEQWLKDRVPILLSLIKNKDIETAAKISQATLDEFSKLKDATLESFILDLKEYTKAREERSKEFHSLMYKMRKELSAKEK